MARAAGTAIFSVLRRAVYAQNAYSMIEMTMFGYAGLPMTVK